MQKDSIWKYVFSIPGVIIVFGFLAVLGLIFGPETVEKVVNWALVLARVLPWI